MASNVMRGSRTSHFSFYTTQRFKEKLNQNWDIKNNPKTARLKRNPKNPREKIPFESQRDFVETIMRAVFLMGKFEFDFFMERNNPDHPDFPDE